MKYAIAFTEGDVRSFSKILGHPIFIVKYKYDHCSLILTYKILFLFVILLSYSVC